MMTEEEIKETCISIRLYMKNVLKVPPQYFVVIGINIFIASLKAINTIDKDLFNKIKKDSIQTIKELKND